MSILRYYKRKVTIFGVWNDIHLFLAGFFSKLELIFTIHWSMLSFFGFVSLSDSMSNRSTLFVLKNDVWHGLSGLERIFIVHCSMLTFHGYVFFVNIISKRSIILVCGRMTLASFLYFIDQCTVHLYCKFWSMHTCKINYNASA